MAVSKGKLEEYTESHKLFNKMRKDYPKNPDVLYNQGLIFKQQNEFKKAQNLFEQTLLIQSRYHQAFHALANIQLDNHKTEQALENFSSAWNILPNNPTYIRSVCKVLLSMEHYNKCFSIIETLALSPNGSEDDMHLAIESRYRVKASTAATQLYELAIKRYPSNADFLLIGGLIEIDKKRIVLALDLLERAKEKAREMLCFDIEANLILCRFLLRHDDAELKMLDRLINDDSPEAHYQFIGNLYETLGSVPVALSWANRGLERFPQNKGIRLLQAKCLVRLSSFDDAELILRKMQEYCCEDDTSILFEQVKLFEKKQEYQSAADSILKPNTVSLYN
jgi:tetratricopeptide (TPR) repeat protein